MFAVLLHWTCEYVILGYVYLMCTQWTSEFDSEKKVQNVSIHPN